MASVSVYEYRDYKKFVQDWIEQAPHGGRGYRRALAEAIGCQTPFITHVLSGNYHFSAEQAERCGRWMGLTDQEVEFLVLLVMQQRSGTKTLEKLWERQIADRRKQSVALKKRVAIRDSLSREDQLIYYSSWHYAAVHMALLNPESQHIEGLQEAIQLPLTRLVKILDFLIDRGLVRKDKNLFKVAKSFLHLELESPLVLQHHTNWRLKAVEAVAAHDPENLHYSGVISLSREDFEWVRARLSLLLEEIAERIKGSSDESLATLAFDWFRL